MATRIYLKQLKTGKGQNCYHDVHTTQFHNILFGSRISIWFGNNVQTHYYPDIVSEHIISFQCYELTRRCSHLLLYIDFTIDLWCAPLVSAL